MTLKFLSPRLISLGIAAFLSLGASSCNSTPDLTGWVSNVSKLRDDAWSQAQVRPYTQPQYAALKAYFSELANQSLGLSNNPAFQETFNQALGSWDLNALCTQILLPREQWSFMMRRCTKNHFFLCAEEVRTYPEILKSLRSLLRADLQKRFDDAPACVSLMEPK